MAKTLEEVRQDAFTLPGEEQEQLAEELMIARWRPEWRAAWAAESMRRYEKLRSGEDPGIPLEDVWPDDPV